MRKKCLEQTAFTENNEKRPVYNIFGEQAYIEPIEQMSFFSDRLSNRSGTLFYSSGNYRCFYATNSIQLALPRKVIAPCL